MNTIVTHMSPDLDAVSAVWLIHRFMPGWKDASVKFVPAGKTLDEKPPDENLEIIHVDTGFGQFDHHQSDADTCATKLVFEHLQQEGQLKAVDIPALERLADVVNRYDHFREVFLENPDDDMHDFSLESILSGLLVKFQDDHEVVHHAEIFLDGILINLKNKVSAEAILTKALEYTSYWGKTIAVTTDNDEVLPISFKKGYDMAIRKSKQHEFIRVKVHPKSKKNLKKLYDVVKKEDPEALWYYHPSGKMLLNGSVKHKNYKATKLSLNEMVQLTKEIK